MAQQWMSLAGNTVSLLGNIATGNVLGALQNVGDYMSIFSKPKDVTNYKKQLENAKALSKQDYQHSVKLLKKEYNYNKKLMSNSSKATQALNQALMDYQYGLERESRQSAYQDTRMDLEAAGYNPLLAVGQQSGYTSVGSGVSASSEGVEASQIASSAAGVAKTFSDIKSQYEAIKQGAQRLGLDKEISHYTNDLTSAKAEHERSMTRGQDISNNVDMVTKLDQALETLHLTRQERENLIQTRENLIQQNKNLVAEENEIKSRTNLNSSQAYKTNEEAKYVGYNALTDRKNANTARKNANINAKRQKADEGKSEADRKYTDWKRHIGSGSVKVGPVGVSWSP